MKKFESSTIYAGVLVCRFVLRRRSTPASGAGPSLRHRHHQRPHHRRHRLALVFRRYRHSCGKIDSIGNLSAAPRTRTVDAGGKVVAPGFIDMLGQSESTILVDPRCPQIYQGITTEITGEGESIAPLTTPFFAPIRSTTTNIIFKPTGGPFANIFPHREARHGNQSRQLRGRHARARMVLGDNDVQPTAAQLETDERTRPPSHARWRRRRFHFSRVRSRSYAKTEELIALAAEASNSAASTLPICVMKAPVFCPPSTRPCASAAKLTSPSKSGIQSGRSKPSWGHMPEAIAKVNPPG